ncbi:MAG: DUF4159 domain-containing protein [Alphaproteobacteria bacterium]|nr:DUF4159 domain-containing protein [Alphaproteobacteria bacterium]
MLELGSLAFATPWMLAALLLLPLLWWLLRVTPPAPKLLRFPAIRLLFGLENPEQTPESSPLWLILLRLAAATALILALAGPLINPGAQIPGQGPILLVVDDDWASAPHWSARQATLRQTVAQAEREGRGVILATTAKAGDERALKVTGVLKPADARGQVDALQPKPWSVDRQGTLEALESIPPKGAQPVVWLSNGLQDAETEPFLEALQRYGPVRVLRDKAHMLPRTLQPSDEADSALSATIRRTVAGVADDVSVRAVAEDGRVLGRETATFAADQTQTRVGFDFPTEVRNEVVRLDIDGENSAAAVVLLDDRWHRRPVGLATEKPLGSGPRLLSETYYLQRALRPYADIQFGAVAKLVRARRAVIIIPDAYTINPAELPALNEWIENGGLLLRFAGPRLARNEADELTPVRLRRGGRELGGALLWSQPARLAPFSGNSPFVGLEVPKDVTISRQVLAEPSLDLSEKTWAHLSDGTPLVTTERRDKGRIVLIHTTASTRWTSLPLSGLFVDMLRRIVSKSRGVAADEVEGRPLPPLELLDGFGRAVKPTAGATSISGKEFANIAAGPEHPPGYYGAADVRRALNLAPQVAALDPLGALPAGVEAGFYTVSEEFDLKPWLLLAALILLLADIVATLALRGLLADAIMLRRWRRAVGMARHGTAAALIIALSVVFVAGDAIAQQSTEQDRFALEASLATRLAYVVTGDRTVDSVSEAGLIGLSNVLTQRTAVETGAPIGVHLAEDELAFFSLIYWPITQEQTSPSDTVVAKLNRYLENGGTILFDTRNRQFSGGGATQALQRLTRGLNLPPLEPIPPDHVLTKAFYLMQDFPGRWSGGRVWVERGDVRTNDGVSRIITGGNDWAAAWAIDGGGRPMFPVVPGGERQREMAYRFGVNLVMYTLTGNYKSDQVHVPAILERLGQ